MSTTMSDKVWERVTSGHLRCSVEVLIVTSGYTDRYVTYRARWELKLDEGGAPRARLTWSTQDDVIGALLFLTGRGVEEVVKAVMGVKPSYVGLWESLDGTHSSSGPVRPEVLDAIAKLATQGARVEMTFKPEAIRSFRDIMRSASKQEIECARWHLAECNRTNAKTGRDQVAFPELPAEEQAS
jgi:hypothetical protein